MAKSTCLDCGQLTTGSRCGDCRRARGRERERTRQRPGARQRGYDSAYERNRDAVLGQSRTCWLCGHDGADQADHVTPTSQGGGGAVVNLKPVHGTQPCPTCKRRCNQSRGAQPVTTTERH